MLKLKRTQTTDKISTKSQSSFGQVDFMVSQTSTEDIQSVIRKKVYEYIANTNREPKYLIIGHLLYDRLRESINARYYPSQPLSIVEEYMNMEIAISEKIKKHNTIEVAG